jgi:ABC-2 type transport system ATP-binding protein
MTMIVVENLKKAYGPIEALRGINFQVGQGEIVGLLGPNGAGKSTTIKILTGCLAPDEGNVQIDNLDVLSQTQAAQAEIGYLSENTPLYPDLSVQAYLKLMADLRGIPAGDHKRQISQALSDTGLINYRTRLISQLSKGLRQRVGIAQAILHRPKLLILDEPTVGLDPTQILDIRELIRRLSRESTILFSSHILSEVEALCQRVIIIINGQIRADSRLVDLAATTNTTLTLQAPAEGVPAVLRQIEMVREVVVGQDAQGYPTYRAVSDADIAAHIFELAKTHGWPVRELRRDVQTLESIFNRLVTAA